MSSFMQKFGISGSIVDRYIRFYRFCRIVITKFYWLWIPWGRNI